MKDDGERRMAGDWKYDFREALKKATDDFLIYGLLLETEPGVVVSR